MIEIKIPTEKDVVGIQDVFYQTWLATYPNETEGITKEDIKEKFKNRLSEESIQKRIDEISNISEHKIFLVAKDSDLVVGVCKAEIDEQYNKLSAIYVLPEYQGNGIGKMFWQELKNFFDYKKDTTVCVASFNEKAIDFYKKLGFIETGNKFSDDRFKMPISGAVILEIEMILKNK